MDLGSHGSFEITTMAYAGEYMFLEQNSWPHFFLKQNPSQEGAVLKAALFLWGEKWHLGGVATLSEAASFIWQIQDFVNGLVLKSGDGWEGWICFFF